MEINEGNSSGVQNKKPIESSPTAVSEKPSGIDNPAADLNA